MNNEYGLNVSYFENVIKRELLDIRNQTPSDLARVFARLAKTADKSIFLESEFKNDAWIACKDRLPPKNMDVLIYPIELHCDETPVYTGQLESNGDWKYSWVDTAFGFCEEITHWQPLPEPLRAK